MSIKKLNLNLNVVMIGLDDRFLPVLLILTIYCVNVDSYILKNNHFKTGIYYILPWGQWVKLFQIIEPNADTMWKCCDIKTTVHKIELENFSF